MFEWWCGHKDEHVSTDFNSSACFSVTAFFSLPILTIYALSLLLVKLPSSPPQHVQQAPGRNWSVAASILCVPLSIFGIAEALHHPHPYAIVSGSAYTFCFLYAGINIHCHNAINWVYFLVVGELVTQTLIIRRDVVALMRHGYDLFHVVSCLAFALQFTVLICLLRAAFPSRSPAPPAPRARLASHTAAFNPNNTHNTSPLLAQRTLSSHSLARGGVEAHKPTAEESACVLSLLTYWWIWPVLNTGYKRGVLEMRDLPPLSAQDNPTMVASRFEIEWARHVAYCKSHNTQPSLLWVLHQLEWPSFYLTALLKLMSSAADFAVPLLLNQLLSFLADKEKNESSAHGYLLAVGMSLCGVLQSLTEHQFWIIGVRCGMHTQEALVAAVFRKVFVMAPHERTKYNEGTILNHMSVDACRINDSYLVPSFHWGTWSALLTIGVSLLFLHRLLGDSAFVGSSFLLVMWPLSTLVAKRMKRQISVVQGMRDKRASALSQLLSLHRVIKAYVWEEWSAGHVTDHRCSELQAQRRKQWLGALNSFLIIAAQVLAPVISFIHFTQVRGRVLDAPTAFSALAWFNIIQRPLGMLPWAVSNMMDTAVSMRRLTDFLLCAETNDLLLLESLQNQTMDANLSIDVQHASFAWADPNANNDTNNSNNNNNNNNNNGNTNSKNNSVDLSSSLHAPLLEASTVESSSNPNDNNRKAPEPQGQQVGDAVRRADAEAGPSSSMSPSFSFSSQFGMELGSVPTARDTLTDIHLQISKGQFVVVVGGVGCGKTSLLAALTRSIRNTAGSLAVQGSLAYVSQQPWIQNMTIRQNILFGKPFDMLRYRAVVESCALLPDLEMLDEGDATSIGEEGINLSGGQRQRISLARAVYADADIVLLDDVLSAVDSHVGRHIFDKCLVGLLKHTTRVMVTHQTHFLSRPEIDMVVVMAPNGTIAACGTVSSLLEAGNSFVQSCLATHASQRSDSSEAESPAAGLDASRDDTIFDADDNVSEASTVEYSKERKAVGAVNPALLRTYLGLFGGRMFVLILVACFVVQPALRVTSSLALSAWVNSSTEHGDSGGTALVTYAVITAALCGMQLLRLILLVVGAMTASKLLHNRMLDAVVHAPCWFYDRELTGRIMNRFVKDVSSIDEMVPTILADLSYQTLLFLSVLITISYVVPPVLIFVAALSVPYVLISVRYMWPARDLRRLESTSRSPLFSHFAETIRGVETIRAFCARERFVRRNIALLYCNVRCSWLNWVANQWVTVWLELIGYGVILACSSLSVYLHAHHGLKPSLIGVALTYVVQIPTILGWCLKQYTRVEVEFVAVERVTEYFKLEQENQMLPENPTNNTTNNNTTTNNTANTTTKPQRRQHVRPRDLQIEGWPSNGRIEFSNLSFRYQDDLPLVLNGFSCVIPERAKVAIVGRTGSGKSSLVLSLLRFYKSTGGKILLDNQDLLTLPLALVRSTIRYMPQTSALLGANIRDAILGPRHEIPDAQIWKVLSIVGMEQRVRAMAQGLNSALSDGGANLSSGERQLLCLARALLTPTKILLCDEATSAVDVETDEIVTSTLLRLDTTVLFICHRLHRVHEFDLVLVMGKGGKLIEFAKPSELLAPGVSSVLRQMVNKAASTKKE